MNTHYDRNTLIDYLHGALEPATDAAVFAHLEICGDCRSVRSEEIAIGDALRAAFAGERELEMPSMVKARVWDAIRHQKPTLLDRLRSRWAPAIVVPVAAAIALAAYLGTPIVRHSGPTGIAASFYLDEHNAEATQNPLGPSVVPAVYTPSDMSATAPASYIDTADAATLDSADGAVR